MPVKFFYPLTALIFLHAVFMLFDVYSIPHLDSFMHLAGGAALGMFVYGMLAYAVSMRWCRDPGKPVTLILVVSLVVSGAVCWEFYEWVSDRIFGTAMQLTLADTLKDLFLGLLGGVLYTGFVFTRRAAVDLSETTIDEVNAAESEVGDNRY